MKYELWLLLRSCDRLRLTRHAHVIGAIAVFVVWTVCCWPRRSKAQQHQHCPCCNADWIYRAAVSLLGGVPSRPTLPFRADGSEHRRAGLPRSVTHNVCREEALHLTVGIFFPLWVSLFSRRFFFVLSLPLICSPTLHSALFLFFFLFCLYSVPPRRSRLIMNGFIHVQKTNYTSLGD